MPGAPHASDPVGSTQAVSPTGGIPTTARRPSFRPWPATPRPRALRLATLLRGAGFERHGRWWCQPGRDTWKAARGHWTPSSASGGPSAGFAATVDACARFLALPLQLEVPHIHWQVGSCPRPRPEAGAGPVKSSSKTGGSVAVAIAGLANSTRAWSRAQQPEPALSRGCAGRRPDSDSDSDAAASPRATNYSARLAPAS